MLSHNDPLRFLKAARGEQMPQAKLSEEIVLEIRKTVQLREEARAVLKNYTNSALAKEYGVHERTIDKAVQGYSWTHI